MVAETSEKGRTGKEVNYANNSRKPDMSKSNFPTVVAFLLSTLKSLESAV